VTKNGEVYMMMAEENKGVVATLALGSRPRQRFTRVRPREV
jgi:hypothetical protein